MRQISWRRWWTHRDNGPRLGIALLAVAVCLAPCLAQGQQGQPSPRDPQLDLAVMLVRNALTAVNHGNLTGNYTVLRDLGGPAFRERNSAAQLAVIFQQLREQKTDLSPILILDPQFSEESGMNAAGQLQLVGSFPSQPLRVDFRLAFQRVEGGWAIDTVAIGTAGPPRNAAAPSYPPVPRNPANNATRPPAGYTR